MVDLEQLRDWLFTQTYDPTEHNHDPYTTGWLHAIQYISAELHKFTTGRSNAGEASGSDGRHTKHSSDHASNGGVEAPTPVAFHDERDVISPASPTPPPIASPVDAGAGTFSQPAPGNEPCECFKVGADIWPILEWYEHQPFCPARVGLMSPAAIEFSLEAGEMTPAGRQQAFVDIVKDIDARAQDAGDRHDWDECDRLQRQRDQVIEWLQAGVIGGPDDEVCP